MPVLRGQRGCLPGSEETGSASRGRRGENGGVAGQQYSSIIARNGGVRRPGTEPIHRTAERMTRDQDRRFEKHTTCGVMRPATARRDVSAERSWSLCETALAVKLKGYSPARWSRGLLLFK